jgi:hypothetical protein
MSFLIIIQNVHHYLGRHSHSNNTHRIPYYMNFIKINHPGDLPILPGIGKVLQELPENLLLCHLTSPDLNMMMMTATLG